MCFRFGVGWGLPLILGGVLVYGLFVGVNQYPGVTALVLCGICGLGALGYVAHAYRTTGIAADADAKAEALSLLTRAIDKMPEDARAYAKETIKSVVGDSSNPTRQKFDSVIQSAGKGA